MSVCACGKDGGPLMGIQIRGCTCHPLDIGPRCEACVAACARTGHAFTEHKTNSVHCYCGTPEARR